MAIEIERKYIILNPDISVLETLEGYTVSNITQTYLVSSEGETHRVRMREYVGGNTVYTQTRKVRIDKISSREDEREITPEEYEGLLLLRDTARRSVHKQRHTFIYQGQLFEIDVYPEWQNTCIMETELTDRFTSVLVPPFIRILLEVSGNRKYSNAGMALEFPEELV